MLKLWLKEVLKCIQHYEPGLVALHCQEVGGKNYEASMQHVNQFVKAMLGCEELQKYDRARVFLDEDYTAADKFTALGNLYFIHESLEDVSIWDFVDCKFIPVEGREVLSGNIENVQIKEKAKFPQDFFPEFKWSRKGFIRTRWNIKNCLFDLVNIHLFHDASNIIAMQTSPSVYSNNRKAAFLHTLQRFETDQYDKVPMFIFGDFNFRLDSNVLVKNLTAKTKSHQTKGKKDQIAKIVYTEEENGKVVLTIETKGFDYHDKHSEVFSKKLKLLHQYDTEINLYKDKVLEYDINFPPSYPFCEDVNDGLSYMKTRCPSWCDRILLSHSAKNIVVHDEKHKPRYDIIGKDTCMGDHKPVFLFLHLKRSQGKSSSASSDSAPNSPDNVVKKTLSINGESITVDDIEDINIHDYATFAQEQALLPEFKSSIRLKKSSSHLTSGAPVKRRSSFQDIAKQVVSIERVLLNWPRRTGRPRSRHHSSSSEDFNDDEDDINSTNTELGKNNNKQDTESIHTQQSEISKSDPSSKDSSPQKSSGGSGGDSVSHDDVVLSVSSNTKHVEHDVSKSNDGGGSPVEERTDKPRLVKNSEGKEAVTAGGQDKKCPCSCVLL